MNSHKVKIVDISTLIPGPFATFLLGKYLQAEVVKLEDLNQPDALVNMRPTKEGVGLGYSVINKGKKIVKVDLRKDGIEKIKQEVIDADVFIENFKPGRALKLGIGFKDLLKVNPKLIYCSIFGYLNNHPLAKNSAHDLNILSLSGYLDQQIKLGDLSALPPLLMADVITAYHTSVRILSSLLKNEYAIHLQVSMLEAFLEAMSINNLPQLEQNTDFSANDFVMSGKLPCYCLYRSQDGGQVAVAAIERPLWIDFCDHLGKPEWIDKQFDVRLTAQVAAEMQKYEKLHWLQKDLDFCVTPVLSVIETQKHNYV